MTFDEYQKESRKTLQDFNYPTVGYRYVYPTLGFAGEAGEVVNKIKKVIRANYKEIPSEVREDISYELGDVLWYLSQLATEFNLSLDDIAKHNLKKVEDRVRREIISGKGDNR